MTWGTVVSNIPNQFLVFVNKKYMLNITDPSGYNSLWVARGAYGGLRLANDGGIVSADGTKKIPVINSFETGYTAVIATSGDTSKVEVKNLTGRGIFAKKETGELIVSNPVSMDTWCSLYSGTLTLGRPTDAVKTVPQELAAGAAVHFDATLADRMETAMQDDGKLHVTKWYQTTGDGYASQCSQDGVTYELPFITTNKLSGLPLVDFGGLYYGNDRTGYPEEEFEKLGSASMLSIQGGCMGIRELFIVMEISTFADDWVNSKVSPFGGFYKYYWKLYSRAASDNVYDRMDSDDKYCDLYVDGVRNHIRGSPISKRLAVYSFKFKRPNDFSWLGGCQTGGADYGGVRIGEFVAYDRELSEEEWANNVAFLKRKWQTGSDSHVWDMGGVTIYDNNTFINVEAGKTANIKNIQTSSKVEEETDTTKLATLTKKGAGELGIEIITDNTSINVEGGSINFTKQDTSVVTTDKPAENAYLHLDATVRESLTIDENNYVTEWMDCRADYRTQSKVLSFKANPNDGVAASDLTNTTYKAEGPDGMAVVDFGAYNATRDNSSGFYMYENGTLKDRYQIPAMDMFIVAKRYDSGMNAVFSSTDWEFVSQEQNLFWEGNASGNASGALYTMNGRFVKGMTGFNVKSKDGFNVYSVQGATKFRMNLLGGGWYGSGGGIVVGEYLIYNRKLSDVERANTIAYLMNKWKVNAVIPEMKPTKVGTVTFSENVAPVIGNEGTCEIASLQATSADSVFTKKGAGALTVKTLSNVTGLNIEAGELKLDCALSLNKLSVASSVFASETPTPVLEVNGEVSLAENGVVSFEVPDGFEPDSVSYPIVKAASFSGEENLSSWIKDTGDYTKGYITLSIDNNVLYARISRTGTFIIIK